MNTICFQPNGENRTPEIVEALRNASDGTTLHFSPGVYDFFAEGTYRGYFSPSCNTSSDKRVVFPILRGRDITIDGGGACFLFHDRIFPFVVQDSAGITLRNFTVDFSFPRYVRARVEERGGRTLRLRVSDTDIAYTTNAAGNLAFLVGEDALSTCEMRFFLQEEGGGCCYLVAGEHYYENKGLPAPVFCCYAEREGDTLLFTLKEGAEFLPSFRVGARLAISYDEGRMNDVIFLDKSRSIRIEDVHIVRGAGMGIVGNLCEDLTAERLVISPRPERDEIYSTTADGLLLTQFTGSLTLRDCTVRQTMDDAMSIHGFYTVLERITAPDKMTVLLSHPSQSGTCPYLAGDTVTFSDGETLSEFASATVRDAYFARDPDRLFLSFTAPLPDGLKQGDILENKTRMPRVSIEGCTFDRFPALRIGNPKGTLFRGNTVMHGKLVLNDLLSYWGASGRVCGMRIEKNTFLTSGISFLSRERGDTMHEDIVIEGNHFASCPCPIEASHATRLCVRGNTATDCGKVQYDETCREVTEEGNEWNSF